MGKQTFTAGQVLTAAEMNSLQENDYNWTVTTKTASYTLAAGDEGTRIVMNNAGATTITVDDAVFAAGDVVWIHNIGAGTCTITAGTATVSTLGELALEQYAGGHLYFTSASAAIFFPTEQGGGGKILQVVSTTKTDTFSSAQTAGGTVDVTGLSVTITPTSASSTILLYGSVHGSNSTGPSNNVAWFFQRGSTAIGIGDAASTRSRITAAQYGAGFAGLGIGNASMLIEDSPATTSATTYKITLFCMSSGTLYVNRTGTDTDSSQYPRTASSIIALEVSA